MVHDALIHLHKKKAAGEQQQVRTTAAHSFKEDRTVLDHTLGESPKPNGKENLIRGNSEQVAHKVEGKITSKGSAPLLLPHPGEIELHHT
jgi:hypothetical protein